MLQIEVTTNTVFKLEPRQSKDLDDNSKISIPTGRILAAEEATPAPGSHVKCKFEKPLVFGGTEYFFAFAYAGHIRVGGDKPKQDSIKLSVPYKSQIDNYYNPTGSCNVTSIAMCMEYLGVRSKGGQLEDELYEQMEDLGLSRHDPNDLAYLVQRYGLRDKFTPYGAIENVKSFLAEGNPVVTHGYFTASGHIITLVGYDDEGFIVHDPYGEWFASGYRTDLSGAYLHYSYDLIRRTCMPDGDFWVHYISK